MTVDSPVEGAPAARLAIRIFETNVAIEVDEMGLASLARRLTASYPQASGYPTLWYRIQCQPSPRVIKNGVCIYAGGDTVDLLPALELDLVRTVLAEQRNCWLLHAAAVTRAGRGLVLAGPSGAGKSTLAVELVARGASYLSDDCVAINADSGLQGLRRPITFAANRLRPQAPFASSHYRVRGTDGADTDFLLLQVPPERLVCESAKVTAMIRIAHGPKHERPVVERLTAARALQALWPCTLRQDRSALNVALSVVERCQLWTVTTSTVEQAVGVISNLWGPETPV